MGATTGGIVVAGRVWTVGCNVASLLAVVADAVGVVEGRKESLDEFRILSNESGNVDGLGGTGRTGDEST